MKKSLLLFVLIFIFGIGKSQIQTDYFQGNTFYCTPKDDKTIELFQLGMKSLQFEKYHGAALNIFTDLVKKDTTFCDAYFMTGYMLDLFEKDTLAFAFLNAADTLAKNKSIEFKLTAAMNGIKIGRPDVAKRKYEQIKEFFPDSPEGYYGAAVTSPFFGEFEYGLENINTAITKYKRNGKDALFLKAVLLTNLRRYEEAEKLFEEVKSVYKKDENFKIHYAQTLLKLSDNLNDKKLRKKAENIYNSIQDKNSIPENLAQDFIFN